jgi:hypothetical protein
MGKTVFQVIQSNFLLIFTTFEAFQRTGQIILISDSDSIENHFLAETKMFMFLGELRTIPNIPALFHV